MHPVSQAASMADFRSRFASEALQAESDCGLSCEDAPPSLAAAENVGGDARSHPPDLTFQIQLHPHAHHWQQQLGNGQHLHHRKQQHHQQLLHLHHYHQRQQHLLLLQQQQEQQRLLLTNSMLPLPCPAPLAPFPPWPSPPLPLPVPAVPESPSPLLPFPPSSRLASRRHSLPPHSPVAAAAAPLWGLAAGRQHAAATEAFLGSAASHTLGPPAGPQASSVEIIRPPPATGVVAGSADCSSPAPADCQLLTGGPGQRGAATGEGRGAAPEQRPAALRGRQAEGEAGGEEAGCWTCEPEDNEWGLHQVDELPAYMTQEEELIRVEVREAVRRRQTQQQGGRGPEEARQNSRRANKGAAPAEGANATGSTQQLDARDSEGAATDARLQPAVGLPPPVAAPSALLPPRGQEGAQGPALVSPVFEPLLAAHSLALTNQSRLGAPLPPPDAASVDRHLTRGHPVPLLGAAPAAAARSLPPPASALAAVEAAAAVGAQDHRMLPGPTASCAHLPGGSSAPVLHGWRGAEDGLLRPASWPAVPGAGGGGLAEGEGESGGGGGEEPWQGMHAVQVGLGGAGEELHSRASRFVEAAAAPGFGDAFLDLDIEAFLGLDEVAMGEAQEAEGPFAMEDVWMRADGQASAPGEGEQQQTEQREIGSQQTAGGEGGMKMAERGHRQHEPEQAAATSAVLAAQARGRSGEAALHPPPPCDTGAVPVVQLEASAPLQPVGAVVARVSTAPSLASAQGSRDPPPHFSRAAAGHPAEADRASVASAYPRSSAVNAAEDPAGPPPSAPASAAAALADARSHPVQPAAAAPSSPAASGRGPSALELRLRQAVLALHRPGAGQQDGDEAGLQDGEERSGALGRHYMSSGRPKWRSHELLPASRVAGAAAGQAVQPHPRTLLGAAGALPDVAALLGRGYTPLATPQSSLPANLRSVSLAANGSQRLPLPSLLAPPRQLCLSVEALGRLGVARSPLSVVEVRTLVLALAEAVAACDEDSTQLLLKDLRAAASPVGPAPQRLAHYFANALASRALGDGAQRYAAEVPPNAREFEDAWMHYMAAVPFLPFFTFSTTTAVLTALESSAATASNGLPRGAPQPIERLHIIEWDVEHGFQWLSFLRQLGSRPQGPPHAVRITVVDGVARAVAPAVERRREIGRQLKEHLAVAAAVAGVAEFSCELVFLFVDDVEEALGRVQVDRAGRARRRQGATTASGSVGSAGPASACHSAAGSAAQSGSSCSGGRRDKRRHSADAAYHSPLRPSVPDDEQGRSAASSAGVSSRGERASPAASLSPVTSACSAESGPGRRDAAGQQKGGLRRQQAEELQVEKRRCGEHGGSRGSGGRQGGGEGCAVDVLAVSAIFSMQDYPDGSVLATDAREAVLKWVHSLHPDVFVIVEWAMDATAPFLQPRVRECFNFNATVLLCHDRICELASSHGPQGSAARPQQQALERPPPQQAGKDSGREPYKGLKLGVPRKMLQAALGAEGAAATKPQKWSLPRTVDRFGLLMFENFYFGRNILNIVALDGLSRFIRPKSLTSWSKHMRSLGFHVAPGASQVQEKASTFVQQFPDGFGLTIAYDAMSLMWCGRAVTHVSMWTS